MKSCRISSTFISIKAELRMRLIITYEDVKTVGVVKFTKLNYGLDILICCRIDGLGFSVNNMCRRFPAPKLRMVFHIVEPKK